ncbi:hypothetical protein J4732_11595 [Serratia marcescens]|uniref:Uncharacterized protein n=1 Tax=Serratia marcescens TaxID=615 RepID=A0A939NP43_SERMA|nr:hypothetical protein [Serratia marcescens]
MAVMIVLAGAARAEQFSANFKGTDIQEFINTVKTGQNHHYRSGGER